MKNLFKQAVLISILVSITFLVYLPGLSGDFILDDYANLSSLGILENNVNFNNLKDYLASSHSGPLKRPITMLSFATDAQNWPADAAPFKLTNLKIHILNGLLLYLLIWFIFKNKPTFRGRVTVVAFFSAAIWLLHPFFVSTTLYVIQRMAMLPMTFMLAGMSLYLLGRKRYILYKADKGLWLLLFSVFGMTTLSVLSKENGILYLLQIALFELFIVRKFLSWPELPIKLKWILLIVPVLLVLLLITIQIPKFLVWYEVESFNMYERVLSQFRVLTQYLYHIIVPDYFTLGVFGDAYKVSNGLFNPITTILSMLLITSILVIAWLGRNKYVWFSFALFFYFISHLLESTVVPLELYFEHRNYIAAVFLALPMVLFIEKHARNKNILLLIPIVICLYLAFTTFLRTNIWSDNLRLHLASLEKFPESPRATAVTANIFARKGEYQKAMSILEQSPMYSKRLHLQIDYVLLKCNLSLPVASEFSALQKAFLVIDFNDQDATPFSMLLNKTLRDNCAEPTVDYTLMLLNMLKSNPAITNQGISEFLKFNNAMVLLERRQLVKAESMLLEVAKSNKSYSNLFHLVDLAIKQGSFETAAKMLTVIRDQYEEDFKYKFDLSLIGNKILFRELQIKARID